MTSSPTSLSHHHHILLLANQGTSLHNRHEFTWMLHRWLRRHLPPDTRLDIIFTEKTSSPVIHPDVTHVLSSGSHWTFGDDAPSNVVHTNFKVIKHCQQHRIPFLGICFGCQLLNVYHNGALHKRRQHHKGMYTARLLPGHATLRVFEHHFWRLDKIGDGLHVVGFVDNEVAAIHDGGSCVGVQFHPEKSGDDGHRFLIAFLY
jgi:GMP synthase-like glutamine amidotransferase